MFQFLTTLGLPHSTRLFDESCGNREMIGSRLIEHGVQAADSGKGESVSGVNFHRLLVRGQGAREIVLCFPHPAEIEVGESRIVITHGTCGHFQPGNSFVDLAFFDEVGADVIVGVTEVRVSFDGAVALGDSRVVVAHEAVSPPEKSICFRRGVSINGLAIKFHCLIQFTLHLVTVGVVEELDREIEQFFFSHTLAPKGFRQAVRRVRYNYNPKASLMLRFLAGWEKRLRTRKSERSFVAPL